MFETARAFVENLLGLSLEAQDLHFSHMVWRAFVVFCVAVALVRLASRRLLGHGAGFDIIVAIVLGSVLSRGINGDASFFPTLGASALLVMLHHLIATLAYHSHWFSKLLKGEASVLVRDGRVDKSAMYRGQITPDDLDEKLRLNGQEADVTRVAEARLERDGDISVVKAK